MAALGLLGFRVQGLRGLGFRVCISPEFEGSSTEKPLSKAKAGFSFRVRLTPPKGPKYPYWLGGGGGILAQTIIVIPIIETLHSTI